MNTRKRAVVGAIVIGSVAGVCHGTTFGRPKMRLSKLSFRVVGVVWAIVVGMGASPAWGQCVPAPPGLVSWWPGDGNANDIQDGNDGTLVNDATFAPGKVGQAFSFDGDGDSVEIADPGPRSNLDISSFTLDAWINVPSTRPVYQTVVAKTTAVSGGHQRNYGLFVSRSGGMFPDLTPGSISLSFTSGTSKYHRVQGMTVVTDGQWHYVAGTYDGLDLRVFIDGIEETTPIKGSPGGGRAPDVFDGPVTIGLDVPNAPKWPMDGLVDEVGIYNRALSASEIQAIFNAGSAGKCKCPWDLDGNGEVTSTKDLLFLLAAWGPCPDPPDPCPADFDGDGIVGTTDLLALLANWGPCP